MDMLEDKRKRVKLVKLVKPGKQKAGKPKRCPYQIIHLV
jgi:hypothetical protein